MMEPLRGFSKSDIALFLICRISKLVQEHQRCSISFRRSMCNSNMNPGGVP
jgi:hypothetical protein